LSIIQRRIEDAPSQRLTAWQKGITPAELPQWRGGSSVDWANESYRLGRMIYGVSHEARALQLFYETDFLPVVNVQLEKAGVRLAAVLNAALGGRPAR
jgi:nuclease S1